MRQAQQCPDRRRRSGRQPGRPDQRHQVAVLARRRRNHGCDHAGARSGAASGAAAGRGDRLQLARRRGHVRNPATAVRRLTPAPRRTRLHGSDLDHRHLRGRLQRLDHQLRGALDTYQGGVPRRWKQPRFGRDRAGPDSRRRPGRGARGPRIAGATDTFYATTRSERTNRSSTMKTSTTAARDGIREPELSEIEAIRREQPHTMGELVLDSASRHTGIALQFRRDGRPAYVSYGELGTISTEIARGLIGTGIEAGDRVAILGLTSADWTLADCGTQCAGAVVTPIYHTNSPEECAYVLADSGAKLIFCENSTQAAKIARIRDRCPALEHVVLFAGTGDDAIAVDELRRRGAEVRPEAVRQRLAEVGEQDVATLVYTSGTTGPPKGCMLTHANLLATTRMYAEQLQLNDTHSLYQFLPLAHVLARIAQAVALSVGARLIYWSGDSAKIIDELGATGPTHFPAVPRIYEKVHGALIGRMADGPRAQRLLFEWALRAGAKARPALSQGRLPDALSDRS